MNFASLYYPVVPRAQDKSQETRKLKLEEHKSANLVKTIYYIYRGFNCVTHSQSQVHGVEKLKHTSMSQRRVLKRAEVPQLPYRHLSTASI